MTRDRVNAVIEHNERYFDTVDTGGIGIVDSDQLEEHVEAQIHYALHRSDMILFVVDVIDGIGGSQPEVHAGISRALVAGIGQHRCDETSLSHHDRHAGPERVARARQRPHEQPVRAGRGSLVAVDPQRVVGVAHDEVQIPVRVQIPQCEAAADLHAGREAAG